MLPPRSPDLASLDLLASIAELGSMGRAAQRHGFSQPAASARIRGLERVLGVELLHRSARGSQLTRAGSAVVDWSAPILSDVHTLVTGVEALRAKGRRLAVAASMTIAEYLMPTWLVSLRRTRPRVGVALQVANSEQVAAAVLGGGAELGFIESPAAPPGLRHRIVARDRLVVVVSPNHPWARRRRPLTPADLASVPMVSRERGSGTREALDEALRRHDVKTVLAVEMASTTAIKGAVAAGVGPAVVSGLAVDTELTNGELVQVPVIDLDLSRPLRAIWRPDRTVGSEARALVSVAARRSG